MTNGKVRLEDSVTLQRMKTSPVALRVLASLIPCKKLGESAEPVKQTLLNGGAVTIEEAVLPKSPVEVLPKAKAAAGFAGLTLELNPGLPKFEDIRGRINLLEEQMDVGARLKPLGMVSTGMEVVPLVGKVAASLTEIHFKVSGSLDDPRVSIIPGQGVADAVGDQAKGVGSTLKRVTEKIGETNKHGLA